MEELEWDTKFWNMKMYMLEPASICDQTTHALRRLRERSEAYMVQSLVPADDERTFRWMGAHGFYLKCTKVSLIKRGLRISGADKRALKEVASDELEQRQTAFIGLYAYSRFDMFSKERVAQYYYTWAKNSIDQTMDDRCIGCYSGGSLMGFITYSFEPGCVKIGLVGVFAQYQRQGVGQKLLQYLNDDTIAHGLDTIKVTAHGANVAAVNAYIKNGFNLDEIRHWYYLHG